jgi:hypothetical protein
MMAYERERYIPNDFSTEEIDAHVAFQVDKGVVSISLPHKLQEQTFQWIHTMLYELVTIKKSPLISSTSSSRDPSVYTGKKM